MLIDTHIHLSHFQFNGEFPYLALENGAYEIQRGTREALIAQMKDRGVAACVEAAIDMESNGRLLALAREYPGFLFPAVGLHPTRTFRYKTVDESGRRLTKKVRLTQRKTLAQYAKTPGVVAVGETGLDYHLPKKEQHRFFQKLWFLLQLEIAHANRLPVVLHVRDAHADALRLLKRRRRQLHGGVCHCFSGSPAEAREYVRLGLMLGIGGALLAKGEKQARLEKAVIQTPLQYLVLETDGPYVRPDAPALPKKQRAKARNTSLILPAVAERIAALKGVPVETVARVTTENARRLFGLPLPPRA